MQSLVAVLALAATVAATPAPEQRATSAALTSNMTFISRSWGQISTYQDNDPNYFGVEDVGLPDGCQIEQVHALQRHAQRFPTGSFDDGTNDLNFAGKVMNWTAANSTKLFTGALTFLNTYQYQMGASYLTGIGAATEFTSAITFWNRYGRTLYNASVGQVSYNASFTNGTARPKLVFRTTSQSRIENSEISWALGFFGQSYETVPNPTLANFADLYNVVIIPEGGTENNTLASYDSCFNDDDAPGGELGDLILETYVPLYLKAATARMQKLTPSGFTFTVNDTYAMQSICAYETGFIGQSDFCGLFTEEEWEGFEATLDIEYYYDYSFGSPTGRAQGIGYLQELIARLEKKYITTSDSSVNSTLDNNPTDFPLDDKFYIDFTHDDILISVMTAMSLDYLKDPVAIKQYPPNPDRHFILSHLTPFGARLVTEVIGCASANPTPFPSQRTAYTPGQYGYNPANATHKFIRMRLNNGILPLSTIRGGACGNRSDGMCSLPSFLESQTNAYKASNYDYACFANYTITNPLSGKDYDGAITA